MKWSPSMHVNFQCCIRLCQAHSDVSRSTNVNKSCANCPHWRRFESSYECSVVIIACNVSQLTSISSSYEAVTHRNAHSRSTFSPLFESVLMDISPNTVSSELSSTMKKTSACRRIGVYTRHFFGSLTSRASWQIPSKNGSVTIQRYSPSFCHMYRSIRTEAAVRQSATPSKFISDHDISW